MTQSVDPKRIPDDAWELVEVTASYRRYICQIDEEGTFAQKTEFLANDKLIADNQQMFHDSLSQRFGDEGRVIARIPMNVLYGSEHEINKKMVEGDWDHLKWWLNNEKARPFRTFRGRV